MMSKLRSGLAGLIRHLMCLITGLYLLAVQGYAQEKVNVSGKVLDEKGAAIIGATIIVKGSKGNGASTDESGRFTLPGLVPDAVLVVSYLGYQTREIPLKGRKSLSISLVEDSRLLEDVVIIGYGTQKKGDVTSSVASVRPENFAQGAIKDVGQLIQGKVAGLAVSNPSGDPTSTTQFRLRGTNTIGGANTAPLVLIDGVPGSINTVAPEDVESVDVLKDGSAAAIYGTRGTNGVIFVTTKKSKGGETNQVDYNGYMSTSRILKKPDLLNATEFAALYPNEDHGASTEWLDEIMRTPFTQVHNLSLRGGASSTNYIVNLNSNSSEGIMLKSANETFQGRTEVTHKMFDDKLQVKVGFLGKKNKFESTANSGSFSGYTYRQALLRNPTDPVKNADGSWYENLSKFEYENPVARLEESYGDVKNTEVRFNGGLTFNPVRDLTLSGVMSYVEQKRNHGYSETLNHASARRDGFAGWSSVGASARSESLVELTALYNKQINRHKMSFLGGYSYNGVDFEDMYFSNFGFQDDQFGGWHNIGIGSALKEGKADANSHKWTTNLIGFFGRATYSFDDRYLLMASLRYEGASQLWGTDNEWGAFPAVSLGWRITREPFMKDQNVLDDLKLRIGYGVTGSQPVNGFLGVAMLKYDKFAYVNGKWVQTIVPASNPNPDLKWEEKKETNIGLDFSLLKNRLSGSIDAYNRNVDGLLYEYSVPVPPNLYNKTWANGGTMQNRGIEVLLSGVPVTAKNFDWHTNVTFSTNSNKLKSLDGSVFKTQFDYFNTGWLAEPVKTESHRVQAGERIGNFWGFKVVDIDENGKWIYEGADGTRIAYNDFSRAPEEKQIIGNGLPKWYAGWNNNFRYKNFDLAITMRGAFGFQIINEARMYYENAKNSRMENRLKSVNDPVFGKTTLSKDIDPEFNSYYVEDGDYWKVDNILLGYTFNKLGKHIKSLRLYTSVLNALVITGYKGVDPEVNAEALNPGYDNRDQYPSIRSFTFGAGIKF
ncbi:SusC/RagA family TonB-linked outer membrane protein [Pararcticibacter amylolyticus]|uniref:SusC/RagA family TonB-linked outer membrane protein n=1 Tax=Pararcticibacter amylolyticus TaxID=2173175 RepID=UPI00192E4BD6|nr:SusC/RagA family TonB-linked outer membrane protein [Pararcticibacter amylolyticus]